MASKNLLLIKKSLLILFFITLIISLSASFYKSSKILEKESLYLSVEISDYIGLNANKDSLNFGTLMPGQQSTRKIHLSNNYPRDLEVHIFLDKGNISSYIYGQNCIILSPNESREYPIQLILPNNLSKGFYEGNLIIEFIK